MFAAIAPATPSKTRTRAEKWSEYQKESRKKHAEKVLRKEKEIQQFYLSLRKGWRRNWIRINVGGLAFLLF